MAKKAWIAWQLDGKSAKRRRVSVELSGQGLRLAARGKRVLWPSAEIRQAQGHYAGEPLRLERGGEIPEALLFGDLSLLTELQLRLPRELARRFHDPSTRRRRAWLSAGAGLATVALALAFHFWIIPATARSLAAKLPLSWEKKLAVSALEIIAPTEDRRMAPVMDGVIKQLVARLAAVEKDSGYEFDVLVVNNPMVNAFALPGGTLVVMSGLLEKTRDPDELAGILAHEMQHVIKRHSTRRLLENSQVGILLSILSGDSSGVVFGAQAAATLASLTYSRRDEAEADEEGMKMLCRAGFDPQGMVRAFGILKKEGELPEALKYLSSHPGIDGRIGKLEALAKLNAQKVLALPLPKDRTWKSLLGLPGPFASAEVEKEYQLGQNYRWGTGVERDYPRALRHYRKAAASKHGPSLYAIGYMHAHGWGLKKDFKEAMKYYRQSAEQGHRTAFNAVGRLYYHGQGVPEDRAEARRWYLKGAELGEGMAMNNLGALAIAADKIEEGLDWYEKGGEAGCDLAWRNLGDLYRDGSGVGRDYRAAYRYFWNCAELKGDEEGLCLANMGWMQENALGRAEDMPGARTLYKSASDKGNAWAALELAKHYDEARQIPRDLALAETWAKKADELGDKGAAEFLLRIRREQKGLRGSCSGASCEDPGLKLPLVIAARAGELRKVRRLLEAGASPKQADTHGFHALMLAAHAGHEDIVRLLIKKGADLNQKDDFGAGAVVESSFTGKHGVLSILLEAGADPDLPKLGGERALFYAVDNGDFRAVQLLVKHGADPAFAHAKWGNYLSLAAANNDLALLRYFQRQGAGLDQPSEHYGTPLIQAVWAGRLDVCKELLSMGANPNAPNAAGLTPLMWAAMKGRRDHVDALLKAGARLRIRSKENKTALDYANDNGHLLTAKTLKFYTMLERW